MEEVTVLTDIKKFWGLPGSPRVKTPDFLCRECGFSPWSGTKIPPAMWCSKKKKKKVIPYKVEIIRTIT